MVCFGFTVFTIRICFRQSSKNRSNPFLCADHLNMFYAFLKVYSSGRRGGLIVRCSASGTLFCDNLHQVFKRVPANLILGVTLR